MEKSMAPSLLKKPENTTSKASSVTKQKSNYSGDEIRSGFLVIASFLTLLGLLFLAGSSQLFLKTSDYQIHFNYISGLSENAPVHFAGHEVGKVTGIQFAGGEEPKVQVTISIREDVYIRGDTEAFINIMGFMGETYIELTTGSQASARLENGATINGTDPIPMMEIIKKGAEIAEEFERTAIAMNNLIDQAQGLLNTNEPNMDEIFSNLNATTENLKQMTEDLKNHPWKLLRKGKENKSDGDQESSLLF